MTRPREPDDEPSVTDLFHAATDDLQMKLVTWAFRDNVLFGEWILTCTLDGRPSQLEWVNRFILDGDKAVEAKGYSDQLPALMFFDDSVRGINLIHKLKEITNRR